MELRLHILIADDETSVSSSLLWAPKTLGHMVEVVNDGERALEKLAADPADLLITDHSMPRLSGLQLVRQLREMGYNGKILVLSAHLSQQNRAAYDSLGVNAMLPKPFDVDELRKTIDELFRDLSAAL